MNGNLIQDEGEGRGSLRRREESCMGSDLEKRRTERGGVGLIRQSGEEEHSLGFGLYQLLVGGGGGGCRHPGLSSLSLSLSHSIPFFAQSFCSNQAST